MFGVAVGDEREAAGTRDGVERYLDHLGAVVPGQVHPPDPEPKPGEPYLKDEVLFRVTRAPASILPQAHGESSAAKEPPEGPRLGLVDLETGEVISDAPDESLPRTRTTKGPRE